MNKKPILSLCIPTYNRSKYLKNTLESIVCQDVFCNGEVEIVVSDNASSDDTQQMMKEYIDKHKNIYYYRNEENVVDVNMPIVIQHANGLYRKLCNDTLQFNDNALSTWVKHIRDNLERKPVIFFNQHMKKKGEIRTKSIQEAYNYISYWSTSISCFGIWEEDFCYNENGCEKHLWQVPNLFEAINKRKEVVIYNDEIYKIQGVKNKDLTYGLFEVFYNNFLSYISMYVNEGIITKSVFYNIEKDLLMNFFMWLVLSKKVGSASYKYSETENFEKMLNAAYCKKKYYNKYKMKLKIEYTKSIIKQKIKLKK